VLFKGPAGAAFYKGGHDDWTDNLAVCVETKKRCILLLSNSVRAETIYPAVVQAVFGETGLPWSWEYNPESSPPPISSTSATGGLGSEAEFEPHVRPGELEGGLELAQVGLVLEFGMHVAIAGERRVPSTIAEGVAEARQ